MLESFEPVLYSRVSNYGAAPGNECNALIEEPQPPVLPVFQQLEIAVQTEP
jgi:hypothetical protein